MRGRQKKTWEEKIWPRVVKGDHWIWTGGTNSQGYGMTGGELVHRKVFELTYGGHPCLRTPLADHVSVCHACDIPLCVKPTDLFAGTHGDNMRDMSQKGRARNSKKTHCPAGHPYSTENTYRERRGYRRCKICMHAAHQAYENRLRHWATHLDCPSRMAD